MEHQMTNQQFRELYHRLVESMPPPQGRKEIMWRRISRILWERKEDKG